MLKLKEEDLLGNPLIKRVFFGESWHFEIKTLTENLKEDFSDVETVTLPHNGQYKEFATLEQIEKGRKQEKLSEFNQALMKMKKFKK